MENNKEIKPIGLEKIKIISFGIPEDCSINEWSLDEYFPPTTETDPNYQQLCESMISINDEFLPTITQKHV